MLKVACFICNRANYGRLERVLELMANDPEIDLRIVLSGAFLLEKWGGHEAMPGYLQDLVVSRQYIEVQGKAGTDMVKSVAMQIIAGGDFFNHNSDLDFVVIIGDRFEALGFATAAYYSKFPIVHIQGGEISGALDESARHAITKFSSYHCVSNYECKSLLMNLGELENTIRVTGCPSRDMMLKALSEFESVPLLKGVGAQPVDKHAYDLIQIHPDTSSADGGDALLNFVDELIDFLLISKRQFVWIWPNNDEGSELISKKLRLRSGELQKVGFFTKNINPTDYYKVMIGARSLIGNSSSFVRDSGFLAIPAFIVGSRQVGRQSGRNCYPIERLSGLSEMDSLLPRLRVRDFAYGGGGDIPPSEQIVTFIKELKGNCNFWYPKQYVYPD